MAIVMSIKPEWCDKIFSGEKCFEVRKTIPKSLPTKVYVYNTGSGMVVGEFVASDYVEYNRCLKRETNLIAIQYLLDGTCMTEKQLRDYIGDAKRFYEIRIANPILYKTPIPLSEFGLKRPPKSWCYQRIKRYYRNTTMTNEKKYNTHEKHHESFLYGLLLKLTKRNEKNKMTNEEKYRTTEERTKAQREFCHSHDCSDCPANKDKHIPCTFAWLTLEAEEEKGENQP